MNKLVKQVSLSYSIGAVLNNNYINIELIS